ncbi:MAG: methyltransferase domain-containing protein [Fimbriimonas sp.]|nr:methyltransferase domain-containing protein [Fimbriimonas sp.]
MSVFDSISDLYDRSRPHYPSTIFDDLAEMAGLGPSSRVLEIGCGTGQATVDLAPRVGSVLCVEAGTNLAKRAAYNLAGCANVQIVSSRFESYVPEESSFDAVFAATCWHWLDPASRYRHAYECLERAGKLCILTNGHAFPDGFDPFFREIQTCYEATCDSDERRFLWPPLRPDATPDVSPEIQASGFFRNVQVRRTLWHVDYTVEQYIDLLGTYSDHLAMKPQRRADLFTSIRSIAGKRSCPTIRKHYQAILHVAERLDR